MHAPLQKAAHTKALAQLGTQAEQMPIVVASLARIESALAVLPSIIPAEVAELKAYECFEAADFKGLSDRIDRVEQLLRQALKLDEPPVVGPLTPPVELPLSAPEEAEGPEAEPEPEAEPAEPPAQDLAPANPGRHSRGRHNR